MDVSEYWRNRGEGYYDELKNQTASEKSLLKTQEEHVLKLFQGKKFNSILEVGCGFGRYTKIIYSLFKPEKYLALDISQEQIENAKKYVNNEKIKFQCSKIQDFTSDQKFDLVFASEILMHINFEDIEEVIKKLSMFCGDNIVTVDWFDKEKIGSSSKGYCFMHDYPKLFQKNGAKKVKMHSIPISLKLKTISAYAKLRGRHGIDKQAIIEVKF